MNLNQITVPVANVEKSIAFYEILGLKLIVKDLHYARFECPNGVSTFSVHRVENLSKNAHGIWVYFEIENLDEHVKTLIEKGIVFNEMPNDKSWLWRESHLEDPDGNHLILYFAGENRLNPPWKI